MSVIIFLIILAILILVHEFGHFIVAKKSGIRVDEFGLGFPPKIFSKKWGSTLYTLNAIPFGGFVKIFGEDSHAEILSEEDKKTSFLYKPKWIQALVLVAGVTFNIIFAWLVISLTFIIGTLAPLPRDSMGVKNDAHLIITEVILNSPANQAKIMPGETIVSVADSRGSINTRLYPETVQNFISESKSKSLKFVLKNEKNVERVVEVVPSTEVVPGRKAVGISMEWVGTLRLSPVDALVTGAKSTWYLLKATAVELSKFLVQTITFKSDFSQVSGPVGIAGLVKEANELGFNYLMTLTAIISINLAVINLVPFPALDGGRLLFVFIEAIIRRPINPSVVKWTNILGFSFLMLLMLTVTFSDILKLF